MGWPALSGRRGALALLLALAVLLGESGCRQLAQPPQVGGRTARVGVVLSLSGHAQRYGEAERKGILLAVDELTARRGRDDPRLEIRLEDDGSTRARCLEVVQKFVAQDHVVAILGPTLSNSALAAFPVTQQAGVPAIGVSTTAGGITEIGDYVFRVSLAEAQVLPHTVTAVKKRQELRRAAILYGHDDPFTRSGYEAFRRALEGAGVEVVTEQSFSRGQRDFGTVLEAIRAEDPEAIFVSALLNEAAAILVEARQRGLAQTIVGGNGFNSAAFIERAGQSAEGLVVGAAWNASQGVPGSQEFVDRYRARFGEEPDQFAAQGYSSVQVLAQGFRNARSTTDRRALRDGLSRIKDLDTALGSFSFTESGDAQHPAVVQVVRGGRFTIY